MSDCEKNVSAAVKDQCPMLRPGGVRCSHKATVIPQTWEIPAYCVPGKPLCECCYEALKMRVA